MPLYEHRHHAENILPVDPDLAHTFSERPPRRCRRVICQRFFGRLSLLLVLFTLATIGPVALAKEEITALLSQPIYAMRGGIGTNWHAMEEIHGGSAGKGNPKWDDTARWDMIRTFADWQGMDYMRIELEQRMYQPKDGVFTWDSDEMKTLYVILDWCQSRGADVLLQEMWTGVEWNRIPGTPSAFRSAPNDMGKWADGFALMVDHLVRAKGYTCIRWVNIQNEGWWGSKHLEGYVAARTALDALGLQIPLVGTENSSGMTIAEALPVLGGIEEHRYGIDSGFSSRGNGVPALPFYWGEFGTHISANGQSSYANNMICAKWIVGGLNAGVDGFAKWEFTNVNDVDGEWSFIDTWDQATQSLMNTFTRRPNTFFMMGMLSRYSAKNSQVFTTYASSSDLTTALLKSPNGHWTLFVVNQHPSQDRETEIRLYGLESERTFYRYRVTPDAMDLENISLTPSLPFPAGPGNNILHDILPAKSISVYTAYLLAADAPGVFADGDFAPLPASPLASEAMVWNDTNPNIVYTGAWSSDKDPAAHHHLLRYSNNTASFYEFTYTGSDFRLYGKRDNGSGLSTVFIDGQFAGYADNYAPLTQNQRVLYDSGALLYGVHTVRVTPSGRIPVGSRSAYVNLDAIGFSAGARPVGQ